MQNINSIEDLNSAIRLLETEQALNGKLFKEQFLVTYESLKPVNLLKSTMNEVTSSPFLINNLLGTVIGMGTGYVSKKIVTGSSSNPLKKLFGSILQFGVANIVSKNSEVIESFARSLYQRFFSKEEDDS